MIKPSYSSGVRAYLCERTAQEAGFIKHTGKDKKPKRCCLEAFLSGAMLYSKKRGDDPYAVTVESGPFSELLLYLFIHTLHAEPTVDSTGKGGREEYVIRLDAGEGKRFCDALSSVSDVSDCAVCPDCIGYFLRGAFLSCGTVTDPAISYHAEFITPSRTRAEELFSLLLVEGREARVIERRGSFIVYIKGAERISDLFTLLGAQSYALDVIEKSIEKEMKNALNRSCNCENANTRKTVSASVDTRAAIEKIKEKGAWSSLPAELRQAAELRLAHPDASLSELCLLNEGESVSRSGLNHRLKKLCAIAKELD